MMDKVGDFRSALGCLGRANLRMGPPQPFPLAVIGKITRFFSRPKSSGECQFKSLAEPWADPTTPAGLMLTAAG